MRSIGIANPSSLNMLGKLLVDCLPRGEKRIDGDYSHVYNQSMNKRIELPTLKCLRCGHEWVPNRPVEPKVCPKCKSPYWNKPKWKGLRK
jgi:predicted Zn-ribbon and HTH transcriptional regulator